MIILQLLLIACQAYAVDLYVIGGDVNGNNWLLKDPSAKMTPVSAGVWEWSGETLSSGFKINDGTWTNPDYNIGSNGQQLRLGSPYYYSGNTDQNISIKDAPMLRNPHLTLDTNRGTILLEGEAYVPEEAFYLVGTFNGWAIDTPEALMEREGNRYVKRGVVIPTEEEAGDTGRFKIATSKWLRTWGYGWASDYECITPEHTIVQLTSDETGGTIDMYYTISGTYDVWWEPSSERISFVRAGRDPDDPFIMETDYGDLYIIGDNVNGNHWLLADEGAKFTPLGKGVYEWSGTYLGNGFKINDGTWNDRYVAGITLNMGSNGDGLVLGEPYYFQTGGSTSDIMFADVTEVFYPHVVLDMKNQNLTVTIDGNDLTLSLPADAADGRYKNCVLELTDEGLGSKIRYIVTDRLVYIFNGLGAENDYTLRMFTPSGIEIASLEGIRMPKADMEVSFSDIKGLYPVGIEILSPDGEVISDGLTLEWYTANSSGEYSYLRQGVDAGAWPAGTELLCKVALGERLSLLYRNPADAEVTVGDEAANIRLTLDPLARIRLTGQVTDDSGSPLEGVTVTVTQLLNGKYRYSATARTDRAGNWTAEAIEGSAPEILFSAKDYVTQRTSLAALGGDSEEISLGKTVLPDITGAKISIAVSYRAAGSDDISSFFTDYQNLALEVFNVTQGRAHANVSVQYPILAVLDENIQPGDELRLTLRSLTGLFAPVTQSVILDADRKGAVEAVIVGKGGIKAGFSMTDNPEVTASLYNAAGELIDKKSYSEASVQFTGLDAGKYSLLSMGRSDMMDAPLRLALLSEIGLKEGKDYVIDGVEVLDGEMTLISNSEIPAFDESPYYFTSDKSGVSANKSSITTGNYLTLRADVDFRGAYADKVKNVSLIFDFPQGSDFVNQSVISGSTQLPYDCDGNRLIIPLGDDWKKVVRFCVIPTVAGRFTTTANLHFDYEGEEKVQPLGYASSDVKEMEITVPSVISTQQFIVSGSTLANSQVSVYDDTSLIGTGKANSAGAWKVTCELPKPYNLSVHPVHAEVLTATGNNMISEKKSVTYDMNSVNVSKVTMYHWNPEWNKTYTAVFDFINPSTVPTRWTVYYPRKQFTYTIEFTENNPEKISNVILYVHTADGKYVPVEASYSASKGCWYASIDMGCAPDAYYPVNCSIDFDYTSEVIVDADERREAVNTIWGVSEGIEESTESMDAMLAALFSIIEDNDDANIDTALEAVLNYVGIDSIDSIEVPELKTEADVEAYRQEYEEFFSSDLFNNLSTQPQVDFNAVNESLEFIRITELDGIIDIAQLLDLGYQEVEQTNGNKLYMLLSETEFSYIDPEARIKYTVDLPEEEIRMLASSWKAPGKAWVTQVRNLCGDIEAKFSWLDETWAQALKNVATFFDWLDLVDPALQATHAMAKTRFGANMKLIKELVAAGSKNWTLGDWNEYYALKDAAQQSGKLMTRLRQSSANFKRVWTGALNKGLGIIDILGDLRTGIGELNEICHIYLQLPDECPDDKAKWTLLIAECASTAAGLMHYWTNKVALSVVLMTDLGLSAAALIPSVGASMAPLAAGVAGLALKWGLEKGHKASTDFTFRMLKQQIRSLKCNNKCGTPGNPPCPKDPTPSGGGNGGGGNGGGGGAHPSGCPSTDVEIDPSGYVYEAVRDNRVEGVQASIYYKETKEDMYGEPYDEIMLWNAEEYAQRNPLFTDERGMYRWDVPQGLWQVKFEKDGYVTAYSEWLPVPPPQLDVNIAISQAKQPEVVEARAYEQGVELRFDKFMTPSSLGKENIHVSVDGVTLPGSIELLDEGSDSELPEEGAKYASRVRFVPETPLGLTTGEVRLTVSPNVLSYCGVPMGKVFTQTLDVEKEVREISAEEPRVLYGDEKEITVFALPFEAAAGRTLNVSVASDVILGVEASDARFDAEGKAVITLKGLLPGSTRLYFSIPDVTVTGETDVDVVTEIVEAEAPKASRASGTEVYRGTKVELTTDTRDAVIYYTLDGSCPCDADGTRRRYTVPIVINEDTQILAMAAVGNRAEDTSDVVAFSYTIRRNDMDFALPRGWSWISHSFENPLPADSLLGNAGVRRIVGKGGEVAAEMNASEAYKVEASADVNVPRLSDFAWNPSAPISLKTGMNWIGYPLTQAMTPAEAFSAMTPDAGDVVIGQRGFAEYDGERWVGILDMMLPGEGYLYKSMADKELLYNRSIVSKARALKSRRAPAAGAEVNIHAYRDVMPLVATLTDKGAAVDCSRYELTAYVGDECRGVGREVDGMFMLNIHGEPEEGISLVVTDMNDFSQSEALTLPFAEEVVGSVAAPMEIDLSSLTNGIASASAAAGSLSVDIIDNAIVIGGVEPEEVDAVKVLDMEGQTLLSVNRPGSVRLPLPALIDGVYVVIVDARGNVAYRKVMLK